MSTVKQVAMVFGASRGIGRQIAINLGTKYHVVVLSKTVGGENSLPGTIQEVVQEINKIGGTSEAIQCDVRDQTAIDSAIDSVVAKHKRLDAIIYNPGAIHWGTVAESSAKKYELMHQVNSRGLYIVVSKALPIFTKQTFGRFIVVSPPIYSRFFRGKTAYAMTKVSMSVLVMGLAMELPPSISITGIWPATAIQSYVTDVKGLDKGHLRSPKIFADAIDLLLEDEPQNINGKCLIEEDYLRSKGVDDFKKYRCDPNVEPRRMLPMEFPSLLVKEQDDRGIQIKSKI
ncbi:hypothetical protein HDV06_000272 [Boothiomyces sp. JEL0866]|nr:hypothetical protein HDV06_000272 [Boothiomyces sp. JEL0866]